MTQAQRDIRRNMARVLWPASFVMAEQRRRLIIWDLGS